MGKEVIYRIEKPNGIVQLNHFCEGKHHKIFESKRIDNVKEEFWISTNDRGIFIYSTNLKKRADINLVGWECESYIGVCEQKDYLVIVSAIQFSGMEDKLLYILNKENLELCGFFSTYLHSFFSTASKEDIMAFDKTLLEQYIGESEYEKMYSRDYLDITKKFFYLPFVLHEDTLDKESNPYAM